MSDLVHPAVFTGGQNRKPETLVDYEQLHNEVNG